MKKKQAQVNKNNKEKDKKEKIDYLMGKKRPLIININFHFS